MKTKDKGYDKPKSTVRIRETTKYHLFENHPQNRPIRKGSVQKLKKSIIRNGNLTEEFPITVVEGVKGALAVLDGQHRLQALKELGMPICYKKSRLHDPEIIRIINSANTPWHLPQFVHFYFNAKRISSTNHYNFYKLLMELIRGELGIEHSEIIGLDVVNRLLSKYKERHKLKGNINLADVHSIRSLSREQREDLIKLIKKLCRLHASLYKKVKFSNGGRSTTQSFRRLLGELVGAGDSATIRKLKKVKSIPHLANLDQYRDYAKKLR